MKYVLLGNLSPEWASKQSERIGKAKAKLDKLEQNPTDLNREGFPSRANSDSHCVLGKEASTHGQAFIGRFADSGGPGG